MQQAWEILGFVPYDHGVHALDLTMVHLDNGLAALRDAFGLRDPW
ncbi:hypothetical protein [Dactylosporangium sp. CA-233914]